ncbi:MAG: NIPSNAP family protein [Pseudomonadota bacterium]
MRIQITFIALITGVIMLPGQPVHADGHGGYDLYELRTYHANEGKIDALHARFRNHTMALFEKHGMKNIAYWHPAEQPDTLIYIIAHKNADAAAASWAAFGADPAWQEAYANSIADGRLIKELESVYMSKTDYSP